MAHPPRRLVALSGFGSPHDIEASLKAGFDNHLVKPIDLELLARTLAPAPE
jgi:CheY-like chemotaxis protein